MAGHRRLWLPRPYGSYVVSYGVLVFFITLLTGLVLWWPKRWTRKAVRPRFTIHRPLRPARLTLDLHNVVGFYFLLPLIAICLTGLTFGLDWFSKSVYYAASGGETMQDYVLPLSDTTKVGAQTASLDALYRKVRDENPQACQFYFALPATKADAYRVSIVHERGSYYKTDNLFFDQYSLSPLSGAGPYAGRYAEAKPADKAFRMMLDIHDGAVFGFWGKVVALLSCLVGASLPVTGLMLFIRRRNNH